MNTYAIRYTKTRNAELVYEIEVQAESKDQAIENFYCTHPRWHITKIIEK